MFSLLGCCYQHEVHTGYLKTAGLWVASSCIWTGLHENRSQAVSCHIEGEERSGQEHAGILVGNTVNRILHAVKNVKL